MADSKGDPSAVRQAVLSKLLQDSGLPVPEPPRANMWNMGTNGMDPAVDRAVVAVQKEYPADVPGVQFSTMPWSQVLEEPDTNAETISKPGFMQSVAVNPEMSITGRDHLSGTLAHEIQHVRQNRKMKSFWDVFKERDLPYEDRPREKEAFSVGDRWKVTHPSTQGETNPRKREKGLMEILSMMDALP